MLTLTRQTVCPDKLSSFRSVLKLLTKSFILSHLEGLSFPVGHKLVNILSYISRLLNNSTQLRKTTGTQEYKTSNKSNTLNFQTNLIYCTMWLLCQGSLCKLLVLLIACNNFWHPVQTLCITYTGLERLRHITHKHIICNRLGVFILNIHRKYKLLFLPESHICCPMTNL